MKFANVNVARTSWTLGLAALAIITGPFALADDSGWYVGGNVGQSRAEIDEKRITSSLLGSGLTTTSFDDDDRDIGYKLFGGYQFNRYFALEGGYFDLGEFSYTATTVPSGTLNGNIELRGVNLDAVGLLPITEKFSAFGRIGVNYAEAEDSFAGTGVVTVTNPSPSERDTNYKYGLGVQYALTEALLLRAEVERYRIDDAVGNKGDIDLVSAGLIYRFGAKAQPLQREIAPEPVAVVQPEVVTPPPAPRKVVLSADSLFDFGKAAVKPTGKQDLDRFAADLRGADFDVITVTGHTDRIGSHAYNMRLSARRAEAVKAYLMEAAGIPADQIVTRGVDGAEPVTQPGDCEGTKATQALIACLQPDRRVEVEVTARPAAE